jgi:exodeoxyribonuclease VII small subunit
MKKNIKFESAFKRLEEIVEKLETGNIELDESIKVFEEGNALVKLCLEKLNKAEQKIKQISEDSDGNIELQDFE